MKHNQNSKIRKLITKSILFLIFLLSSLFFINNQLNPSIIQNLSVRAQDATDSSIDQDTVKENLKERLEKVVSDQIQTPKIKRALLGNLESIANHTLTINTHDGPKLASVSAQTTFVRLPDRDAIELEDLEIDSYTIAIGYINGNKVLDTYRVVVNAEPPDLSDRISSFVTISEYLESEDILTVQVSTEELLSFQITLDTEFSTTENGQITQTDNQALVSGTKAVIITQEDGEDQSFPILLKIHILP